jgi:hypothetical protein
VRSGPSVTLASGIAYQPLSGVVQAMVYGNGLNDFNSFTADGEIDVLGTYNNGASAAAPVRRRRTPTTTATVSPRRPSARSATPTLSTAASS